MSNDKEQQWLAEGYRLFAQSGAAALNIQQIARNINKNKSSFYHYFGDMESFIPALLQYHIEQASIFADDIKACTTIKPDLIELFVEHKNDLLFHKHLRMQREKEAFKNCYEKAFAHMEEAFLEKWMEFLGLTDRPMFAGTFLNMTVENFLLRITEQNLNYDWLDNYLNEVQNFIKQSRG